MAKDDEKEKKDKKDKKLKAKKYEKELRKLQAKLCILQDWVKARGLRVIVIFEGRDASGKGGTIKAIAESGSPPVFPLVRPPSPSRHRTSPSPFHRLRANVRSAGWFPDRASAP